MGKASRGIHSGLRSWKYPGHSVSKLDRVPGQHSLEHYWGFVEHSGEHSQNLEEISRQFYGLFQGQDREITRDKSPSYATDSGCAAILGGSRLHSIP